MIGLEISFISQWNKSIILKHYYFEVVGFWGFTNSAGTPETETRADFIKLHSCTKSQYCRTDAWLHIYVNTLRIWVWNAKSALPWNRFVKRLQFVKPTCHKIYQGRYNLLKFKLQIYFLSINAFVSINACASSDRESIDLLPRRSVSLTQQFRSFESYLQIFARLTGWWKKQNIGKLHYINFVWNLWMEIKYKNWKLIFYVSLQ